MAYKTGKSKSLFTEQRHCSILNQRHPENIHITTTTTNGTQGESI
jgi:hypothetical protein